MKILAIRGKNLASLAGEFVIDFNQEPLKSAGLFAISGPTGAGKSTLLDALCLALFDNTPRLNTAPPQGASLPDVGESEISQADSRTILRRGCADGYAEVDFVGHDGRSYRSRWSVRRAHGRISGNLQKTEMQLTALESNQRIGSLKTEVLDEIEARLGLSFDQFTRAVLLAQNEFSAFLKAKDDERSSLLQTLTGTEIYSEISRRAFERAKQESDALKLLQSQLLGQQPLSEEERAELEKAKSEIALTIEQQVKEKTSIEQAIQWHQQLAQLEATEQQAKGELQKALDIREQSHPRQHQLNLIEAIQPARNLVLELDRTQQALQISEAAVLEAERKTTTATNNLDQSKQEHSTAQGAFFIEEQNKKVTQPLLVQARQLDTEITTLEPIHRDSEIRLKEAIEEQSGIEQTLLAKQTDQTQKRNELTTTQTWLDAHADLKVLAEEWPRWDALLSDAQAVLDERKQAEKERTQTEKSIHALNEQITKIAEQLQQAKSQQESAEAALRDAESDYERFDATQLSENTKVANLRKVHLHDLQTSHSKQSRLQAEENSARQKLANLNPELSQQKTNLDIATNRHPALAAAHQQAEKMLQLAQLACSESVEKLRAGLEDGESCPVCGALDHPYAVEIHPFKTQLATLKTEVEHCKSAVKVAEEQISYGNNQIENLNRLIQETESKLTQLSAELEQAQSELRSSPLMAEIDGVESTQRSDWISHELSKVDDLLNGLEAEFQAMTTAAELVKQARSSLETANTQKSTTQQTFDSQQSQLKTSEHQLQTLTQKFTQADARLKTHLTKLDSAFSEQGWQDAWLSDPVAYHQQAKSQANNWTRQQLQSQNLTNQLSLLNLEIDGLTLSSKQAAERTSTQRVAHGNTAQELLAKRKLRSEIFDGRSVSEIEAELDQRIATAKQNLELKLQQLQQSQSELAKCQATLTESLKQRDDNHRARKDADLRITQWLAEFTSSSGQSPSLDLIQLREYLKQDHQWIAQERAGLQQLETDVKTAQAVLNERQQKREAHQLLQEHKGNPEELSTQLQVLTDTLKAIQTQHSEYMFKLHQDDDRRNTSAALMAQITTQESTTHIWAKLNDLIGSADGKKFRNIAQQVTLDMLLGYANQHLKDLSRRYRLERIKSTLALQVVDQDMGDEIRSVHSLSGGESFLVSLALALGLASLSSNRVRVESLFIDEGFGSLDAETLRVAMDALDGLQSLGRKVGVISHVQEMTERIGTQIQLKRISGGLSRLEVLTR